MYLATCNHYGEGHHRARVEGSRRARGHLRAHVSGQIGVRHGGGGVRPSIHRFIWFGPLVPNGSFGLVHLSIYSQRRLFNSRSSYVFARLEASQRPVNVFSLVVHHNKTDEFNAYYDKCGVMNLNSRSR